MKIIKLNFLLIFLIFQYFCEGNDSDEKFSEEYSLFELEVIDLYIKDKFDSVEEAEDEIIPECPSGFGCPCEYNDDCYSGWCIIYDIEKNLKVCTKYCYEEGDCPKGWGCTHAGYSGIEPIFICVPKVNVLCKECLNDSDCGYGNKCIELSGHKNCTTDCSLTKKCPGGFSCVEIKDEKGKTIAHQCYPKSGSCYCDETVDYKTDVNNCGKCENKCEFKNAIPACENGKCKLVGCSQGWVNLDEKDENGCEYKCFFESEEDIPDSQLKDSNCDGIDGVLKKAVFVSKNGIDKDNKEGSMKKPFATINSAILFAKVQNPKKDVYVALGTYKEQVKMENNVSIFGGYNDSLNWKRNTKEYETIIKWDEIEGNGQIRTIIFQNIIEKTILDGFTIESGNNSFPSGSSYAVYLRNSGQGVVISNNFIISGNGGNGENGESGKDGLPGKNGDIGQNGCEYSSWPCEDDCSQPASGSGGEGFCGNSGGKGGVPGWGNGSGEDGEAGENGGGIGGKGGSESNDGNKGADGANGIDGKHGKGGDGKGVVNQFGFWLPSNGEDGLDGTDGKGGGGGGGGGGDSHWCNGYGGAGGGGGAGGCGGKGGKGGTGGGGSFGIFILNSSPQILSCTIKYKNGGYGGNGGSGGKGGDGGKGGKGGNKYDKSGTGGNGGNGGKGGNGGGGGGGGGGISAGIFIVEGSNPFCSQNKFSQEGSSGFGGKGGSGINNGEKGMEGDILNTTENCKIF